MFHRAVIVLRVPILLVAAASIAALFYVRPSRAPHRACCAHRSAAASR